MKVVLCVLLCLNLCFAYTLKEGIEAYKKEDFKLAFTIFEALAKEGNASAQYNLGVMYYFGDGVEINKKMAYTLLLQAADQGHLDAQINLDTLCEENPDICEGNVDVEK